MPRSVPRGMSFPAWREITVRRPSEWVKTRCELPRSGCSRKPSFLRTRISSRDFTAGSFGISFARPAGRNRNCFDNFYAVVFGNSFAVGP